jgi:hypothetical protein
MAQGEKTHRTAAGRPRFSIRTLIVVVTIAAFVFAAIDLCRGTMDGLHEAYGKWGLAEMIIAFCEDHGRPPSSWVELEPYPSRAKHLITGWDVNKIRSYLEVDFDQLKRAARIRSAETDRMPIIVVSVRGRDVHWAGADPNVLLWEYFHSGEIPKDASIF